MTTPKTSLLTCLKQIMEKKSWQPSNRLWSLTLWFKNPTSSFLSLRSGSIHSVWIYQLQVAGGNLPSIPHSLKHWLHCPPLTGNTCWIVLSCPYHDARFLYDGFSVEGREGREGHHGRASCMRLLKYKGFPEFFSWFLQGSWKKEMIENRSKLTVRISACWFLHPLHWADHRGGRYLRPDTRL